MSFTLPPPPRSTLFPYTTLFRSRRPEPRFRWTITVTATTAESRQTKKPPESPGAFSCVDVVRPQNAQTDTRARKRSEEHTSELQSRRDLVCRLLLEKKKKTLNST